MSEELMVWEAPVTQQKIEYRLYYDEHGRVITYTCENREGNYILVDAFTFAQSRPDVTVIDGKIITMIAGSVTARLVESDKGRRCASEDLSILVDDYSGETKIWELVTYAL